MSAVVEIFCKSDCPLCDEAKTMAERVQRSVPFVLRVVDIASDPVLLERYRYEVPVVLVNGRKAFKGHLSEVELIRRLSR